MHFLLASFFVSITSVFGAPHIENATHLHQPHSETSQNGASLLVIGTSAPENPCKPGFKCIPYSFCVGKSDNDYGMIDLHYSENLCLDYRETCCEIVEERKPQKISEKCGRRNVGGIGFQIGSSHEIYTDYAHCAAGQPAGTLMVRAGEWDTLTDKEILPHQDRLIAEVRIHEQFNNKTLFNDIALLFLQTAVELAENVQTVCIPSANTSLDHSRCIVTGWDKDVEHKSGLYQKIMKKLVLPVIPSEGCQTFLQSTRLGTNFQLHSSFLCAGGEAGSDACTGFGGSPLVCPTSGDEYFQVGIVSWGVGCGANVPAVFANVALFRDCLDKQLLSIDSEHKLD